MLRIPSVSNRLSFQKPVVLEPTRSVAETSGLVEQKQFGNGTELTKVSPLRTLIRIQ